MTSTSWTSPDLRQEQEVPSGHDPAAYITRRLSATSHDGVMCPSRFCIIKIRLGRLGTGSAVWLWILWHVYASVLFDQSLFLVDRAISMPLPMSGAVRKRLWLVSGWQTTKTEYVSRFYCCRRPYDRRKSTRPGRIATPAAAPAVCSWAPVPICAPVFGCRGRRGSLCRCTHHHVRYRFTSDAAGMAGMGKPIESAEAYNYIKSYSPVDNVTRRPTHPC